MSLLILSAHEYLLLKTPMRAKSGEARKGSFLAAAAKGRKQRGKKMNEIVELRVEKELCEQLYKRLREQKQDKEEEESVKPILRFRKIGHRRYGVFNERTGRFHNPELGIDWVV